MFSKTKMLMGGETLTLQKLERKINMNYKYILFHTKLNDYYFIDQNDVKHILLSEDIIVADISHWNKNDATRFASLGHDQRIKELGTLKSFNDIKRNKEGFYLDELKY